MPESRNGPSSGVRIRTAVIGFGIAGEYFHARFIIGNPAFELVGVMTSSPERAVRARALAAGVEIVTSVDEVLRLRPDLVVVASPPALHCEHAGTALDAGAAVVIDKPFAPTAGEAENIADMAEEVGLPLTVFQNRRWDRDFATIQRLLREGQVGSPHSFESRFEWWKPDLGEEWKSKTSVAGGGGILLDLGPHLVDQAVQLLGPVTEVPYARLRTVRAGGCADDDAFVELLHESGAVSRLFMGELVGAMGPRFRLSGDGGTLTIDGLDEQEERLRQQDAMPTDRDFDIDSRSVEFAAGPSTRAIALDHGSYASFYEMLVEAIHGEGPVPVAPSDAIITMRLLDEVRRVASAQ